MDAESDQSLPLLTGSQTKVDGHILTPSSESSISTHSKT
jgi:hypothetical protein